MFQFFRIKTFSFNLKFIISNLKLKDKLYDLKK